MRRNHDAPDFRDEGTQAVLEALVDGPLTLPEIPRRWPVTRPILTFLVGELLRGGLLAPVPGSRIPGATAYALTHEGRALVMSRTRTTA
jgi:DNA-binding HxlR family transcriptional regulator